MEKLCENCNHFDVCLYKSKPSDPEAVKKEQGESCEYYNPYSLTLKELVGRTHPSDIDARFDGGVKGCPDDYAELTDYGLCNGAYGSSERCTECWNQIYGEPKESTSTKSNSPAPITSYSDQTVKADAGKPKLTLVPQQIIYDIAQVREYGCNKYHDPENWKKVDIQRYKDAAFRHFLAYLRDPKGVDEESGIEHYKHLACNIAFICELEK